MQCNVILNTNMRIFESVLCNKCRSFIVNRAFSILSENLPFHQVINAEADHSIATASKGPRRCSKTMVLTLGNLT